MIMTAAAETAADTTRVKTMTIEPGFSATGFFAYGDGVSVQFNVSRQVAAALRGDDAAAAAAAWGKIEAAAAAKIESVKAAAAIHSCAIR